MSDWQQAAKNPESSMAEFFQRELEAEVLDVQCPGFTAYAAVRGDDEEVRAVICPFRVSTDAVDVPGDRHQVQYRPIPETRSTRPGAKGRKCPESVLERLTPTEDPDAQAWRERVREYHQAREERPTLEDGDRVILDRFSDEGGGYHGRGATFTVRKEGRTTRFEDPNGVHTIRGFTQRPTWVIEGVADVERVLREATRSGAICAALSEQERRREEYRESGRPPVSVLEVLRREDVQQDVDQTLEVCTWALTHRPAALSPGTLQEVLESDDPLRAEAVCRWALTHCPAALSASHVRSMLSPEHEYPSRAYNVLRGAGRELVEAASITPEDVLPFLKACDARLRLDLLRWMADTLEGELPRKAVAAALPDVAADRGVQLQAVSVCREHDGVRAAVDSAILGPLLESEHEEVREGALRFAGGLSREVDAPTRAGRAR